MRLVAARLAWLIAAVLVTQTARSQVVSYTAGIDINCRTGLRECWVLVSEGLGRVPGADPLCQAPDFQTSTCRWLAQDGRLVSPQLLARLLTDLRVGARLRALEATVDGWLEHDGTRVGLAVSGSATWLELGVLSQKVYLDVKADRPREPTAQEQSAFQTLLADWDGTRRRARITGPLVPKDAGTSLHLEVRRYRLDVDPTDNSTPAEDPATGLKPALTAEFQIDTTAPQPPTGLGVAIGHLSFTLDWDDHPEPDVDGYNVFRAEHPGGNYVQISANVPLSRFHYSAAESGKTYYYIVRAVDRSGNQSAPSAEVSATPTASRLLATGVSPLGQE